MLFSILTTLALATTPAPIAINQPLQAIGCHPQPGKVMGCVTNSHTVAQQRAQGRFQPATALAEREHVERTVACHPDPSRNRGCFRAAPGAKVKPAMAARAAKTETAEATPAPAQPSDAAAKSS